MSMNTNLDTDLELFVRSLAPASAEHTQETVIDRLDALDERGFGTTVTVWGERVGLSKTVAGTRRGEYVLDRVAAFKEWARAAGVSVNSFFEARSTTSTVTGEEYTAIVLPVMTLAEYREDELHCVTPHVTEGTVRTVSDRLDALERGAADDVPEGTPVQQPLAEL
jgi:hypothetical protein